MRFKAMRGTLKSMLKAWLYMSLRQAQQPRSYKYEITFRAESTSLIAPLLHIIPAFSLLFEIYI